MTPVPDAAGLSPPPLSLYVHLPWCVKKCPYCDFNSHAVKGELPADEYIDALFRDLEQDLPFAWGRTVQSVFFGGGTPSLFSASQVERMLSGLRGMLNIAPAAEVTLEANPGTTEHDSFSAYRDAGINRISLGVQSFDDRMLQAIGRIHGRREVDLALESISRSGIRDFNLDLMYALPGQSFEAALEDLRLALAAEPTHLSHYQLTLEPNTAFHARPPQLPGEDLAWTMQEACAELLEAGGFGNYEVSAWARSGQECRHNLNYWEYGDFLGIGAGAHGKITLGAGQEVRRRAKKRHPRAWMEGALQGDVLAEDSVVSASERIFEFFLNQSRLKTGIRKSQFSLRTGLPWSDVADRVDLAIGKGLLEDQGSRLVPTALGWRFVNEVQAIFLP